MFRYARMTPEERRAHNNRRRMRQMQNALAAVKASSQVSKSIYSDFAAKLILFNLATFN